MNILVIGNGFDLAHGLPTSDEGFLEFCKMGKEVCNTNFWQYSLIRRTGGSAKTIEPKL